MHGICDSHRIDCTVVGHIVRLKRLPLKWARQHVYTKTIHSPALWFSLWPCSKLYIAVIIELTRSLLSNFSYFVCIICILTHCTGADPEYKMRGEAGSAISHIIMIHRSYNFWYYQENH